MGVYIVILVLLFMQQPLYFFGNRKVIQVQLGKYSRRLKNLRGTACLLTSGFIFLLFAILRDETVGKDYAQYLFFMNAMSEAGWGEVILLSKYHSIEVVFLMLSNLGNLLDFDAVAIMAVWYGIFLALIGGFVRYFSRNIYLSVYLFFVLTFYNQSLNITRQYIAAAIMMAAIMFLVRNKKIKYFLTTLTAVFIHNSAVLVFILYWVKKYKAQARFISSALVALSFFLTVTYQYTLFRLISLTPYAKYVLIEDVESGLGIGLIINGAVFLLFYLFYKRFSSVDENAYLWLFCAAMTLSLNLLSANLAILARLIVYFKIISIVSIPAFVDAICSDKTNKTIGVGIIAVGGMLYYLYLLSFTSLFDTVPYKFM